jgi:hypothetical protein
MARQIGYYVHHHGKGHLARALAIARFLPDCITLLGTGLGQGLDVPCLDLAADFPAGSAGAAGASLHYAPLNHAGMRDRVAALAGWIAACNPAAIICDVSVEIAMLARLTGTPFLYVRLHGNRTDAAHTEAFAAAQALIAPFHETLEDPETSVWVRRKTRYFPGITVAQSLALPVANRILVINGQGGPWLDGGAIAAAASATPGYHWQAIGPVSPAPAHPANLQLLGWVENAADYIASASIIVGAAGDGVVNAVIAAGKPFICLAQDRPYGEQRAQASRLESLGAALNASSWPRACEWPALLERALGLDTAVLALLHDPQGARKVAAYIAAFAEQACAA